MIEIVHSGKKMREKAGCPKILDDISYSEIKLLVQRHAIADRKHFKHIFMEKMKETYIKKYLDGLNVEYES
jgi:hypothetical protein